MKPFVDWASRAANKLVLAIGRLWPQKGYMDLVWPAN